VTALPLILTVFVACAVEAIEALTIVLASGLTREWRSTFQGMAAALVVLAAVVGVLGPTITLLPLGALRLVVGALLAIFGLLGCARRSCAPPATRPCTTRPAPTCARWPPRRPRRSRRGGG
jgi:uncharacterized membrane protein